MDERPLQYSRHALKRMVTNHITEDEVEAIVWYPAWRQPSSDGTVEHYGYSDDGRLVTIVTDRHEHVIVTVIDQRRRQRRRKR